MRPQLSHQAEAVKLRHHHVGEDQVRTAGAGGLQRCLAVGHRLDVVARSQQAADVVAHVPVVVGPEDARSPARLPFVAGRGKHGRGRWTCEDRVQRGRVRFRQPAQGLLHVRDGAERRRGERASAPDPVGRKVRLAGRDGHGERASLTEGAHDLHRAPVELDQFVHQGQADARSLLRAAPRVLHPMEALEDMGDLLRRNADTRIADGELHDFADRPQDHRDLAREGVLERVREEIQDELLPHLTVDVDGLGQRRAMHDEREPGTLAGRAEVAGQVPRHLRQVGRLVHSLDATGLDPREVEERVHELLQPEAVALGYGEESPRVRGHPVLNLGEDVPDRPQHERQRGAELVADVAEERGLGAVQLGQGLGAASLLLVCARAGDRPPRRPRRRGRRSRGSRHPAGGAGSLRRPARPRFARRTRSAAPAGARTRSPALA